MVNFAETTNFTTSVYPLKAHIINEPRQSNNVNDTTLNSRKVNWPFSLTDHSKCPRHCPGAGSLTIEV